MSHQNDINPKNTAVEAFFPQNGFTLFARAKAEKLTTAVYLVTSLFPEDEPLRLLLREKGLAVLKSLSSSEVSAQQTHLAERMMVVVLEIKTLLRIGKESGLISAMNEAILQEEYTEFSRAFEERKSLVGEDYQIPKGFFEITETLPQAGRGSQGHKRHIKDTTRNLQEQNDRTPAPSISKRHSAIIDVLKEEGEVTAADIKKVITGCSDKTIQRDLKELIAQDIVIVSGSRRWSRYSLA